MKQLFSIQGERCLIAAFFMLPAMVSFAVFWEENLNQGRHLLLSCFLVFSGLVSLALSAYQIRKRPWGRWLYRCVPALCFMAAIYWISSLSFTPETRTVLPDYGYHFLEFAVFGYLGLRMVSLYRFQHLRMSSFIIALIFCMVYAALDEVHQRYVPGRNPSLKDLLCDALGIAVGMAAYAWFITKTRVVERAKATGQG